MSRNIRSVVASAREESERKEVGSLMAKNSLEFISRFASLAPRFDSVEDVLGEMGYSTNSVDSETSSFSFSMDPSNSASAVVKGIRRVQFSSDLAHRSWARNIDKRSHSDDDETLFLPWIGQAAVMFVDLSGYSKIASALTNQGGAHALSTAVNVYFEALLDVIVEKFEGDVVSFAGDAICVAWPCVERSDADSALLAASCALELQRKCGISQVSGTDLAFRLHVGITFGEIESNVFVSTSTENMQCAYHFVAGVPLTETALVVDAAKIGEVCVTQRVRDCITKFGQFEQRVVDGSADHVFLLKQLDDDVPAVLESLEPLPNVERSDWLDRNLVPPAIARKLRQGFKAAHVAEMRRLCVLFLRKMVEGVSTLQWFVEVQRILDQCSCPIVQLIDDDKGTHMIAAVNLFRAERDPVGNAIRAVRMLLDRETGCTVGIACGEVFCGITGSDLACRWDVTGPACVRACRLMQYALQEKMPVALDSSVFDNCSDVSQLQRAPQLIALKGSPEPVPYYVLSPHTKEVTSGILSTTWSSPTVHAEQRELLNTQILRTTVQRGAFLASGPVGSGKKTSVLIALGQAKFSSVAHFASSSDKRPLALLTTLAEWFAHYPCSTLSPLGKELQRSIYDGKLTKSLSLVNAIVDTVVEQGIRFCYVIAYATLLDNASIGLIKSVIGSAPTAGTGRFLFGMTAYPLYRARSVGELEDEMRRQVKENQRLLKRLPADQHANVQTFFTHVRFSYPQSPAEFAEAFASVSYFQPTERASRVLLEATGGCFLLIRPLLSYLGTVTLDLRGDTHEIKSHLLPGCIDGTIHVTTAGIDFLMREISWPHVAPSATSRFTELYDVLSPRLQLVLRVVASVSTTTGSANPYHVAIIMQKLNAKVTQELIFNDIRELVSLEILCDVDTDGGELRCAVPAMVDVVVGMLTPDQDRMLKRHAFKLTQEFLEREALTVIPPEHQPVFLSFVARLAKGAGDNKTYVKLLQDSWVRCLQVTEGGNNPDVATRMEERLSTEHRRTPELCNRSIFADASRAPQLEKFISNDADPANNIRPLPREMRFFAADFLPPMALGALSGEYQKMGWAALNNWLDFTKSPGRVFLPDDARKFLHVNLELYMEQVHRFETLIPPLLNDASVGGTSEGISDAEFLVAHGFVLPLSEAEERRFLEMAQSPPVDEPSAARNCTLLMHYYYKVLVPRRNRMVAYVQTLSSKDSLESCACMKNDTSAIVRAFVRFLRESPIPDVVVHEALLDLATAGWQPRYFNVNLQLIRELIFKKQTATAEDFKSFLLATKMFGEEITAAVKVV